MSNIDFNATVWSREDFPNTVRFLALNDALVSRRMDWCVIHRVKLGAALLLMVNDLASEGGRLRDVLTEAVTKRAPPIIIALKEGDELPEHLRTSPQVCSCGEVEFPDKINPNCKVHG